MRGDLARGFPAPGVELLGAVQDDGRDIAVDLEVHVRGRAGGRTRGCRTVRCGAVGTDGVGQCGSPRATFRDGTRAAARAPRRQSISNGPLPSCSRIGHELRHQHRAPLPVGAVHHQGVAAHVGRVGRGQEGRRPAELVRMADAMAGERAPSLLRRSGTERMACDLVFVGEEAGDQAVHADAVGAPLDGQRLGQVLDARLGGGGVGEAGAARPGVGGADVDDAAGRAGGDVAAAELARAVEGAVQHDVRPPCARRWGSCPRRAPGSSPPRC